MRNYIHICVRVCVYSFLAIKKKLKRQRAVAFKAKWLVIYVCVYALLPRQI